MLMLFKIHLKMKINLNLLILRRIIIGNKKKKKKKKNFN